MNMLVGCHFINFFCSCTLCIFLANLEVAIVSTALVAITDDLKSFGQGSWIISAYLLTYTGSPYS